MSSSSVYRELAYRSIPELSRCPERVVRIVIGAMRAAEMLACIDPRDGVSSVLGQTKKAQEVIRDVIWPKEPKRENK
jgi:hypothetical protein